MPEHQKTQPLFVALYQHKKAFWRIKTERA